MRLWTLQCLSSWGHLKSEEGWDGTYHKPNQALSASS